MDVVPLVVLRLVHFHLNAMRVSPRILTDARNLPRDLYLRFAGLDSETAVGDFQRDDGLRKLTDHGELITEIRVERFKPRGHRDDSRAAPVGGDVAVVDVFHVERFDEGVVKILVGWIEWMIDFKGAAGFAEAAVNADLTVEETSNATINPVTRLCVNSVASQSTPQSAIRIDTISCASIGIATASGNDAWPAIAINSIGVSAVGLDAGATVITFRTPCSAERIEANPCTPGTSVGTSAVGANPGASHASRGRLPAVTRDCGRFRRSVEDIQKRQDRPRGDPFERQCDGSGRTLRTCWPGSACRSRRADRSSSTGWPRCSRRPLWSRRTLRTHRTGSALWPRRANRAFRHVEHSRAHGKTERSGRQR